MTKENYSKGFKDLMSAINVANPMAVPRLEKIVCSIGVGNAKENPQLLKSLAEDLAKITGQKPVATAARKAISGFKLQKGQLVGLKVTLRRKKMYHFLDRLIGAVFPAIRDFKGVMLKSIDEQGNLNIGLPEHSLFPEIGFEHIAQTHGLQITIVPTTRDRRIAVALYKTIGFPIKQD